MNVPEELQVIIFSYLDHQSLTAASSVCKNWRALILGSWELLKNSKLLVHDFKEQKKFLLTHGKNFRSAKTVKKNDKRVCSRAEFIKILEAIRNVESLEVAGRPLVFQKNEVTRLGFGNLKELILHESAVTFRLSQFLEDVKLTSLTLIIEKRGNRFDESFVEWFYKQDQLKSLKIQEKAVEFFLKPLPVERIKFQLTKLWIQLKDFEKRENLVSNFFLQSKYVGGYPRDWSFCKRRGARFNFCASNVLENHEETESQPKLPPTINSK
jgi:hypothetical protein